MPQVHHNPQDPLRVPVRVAPHTNRSRESISNLEHSPLRERRVVYHVHDPLIRVYIYNTCASGVYSTRAELSISSSYRAAISEPVPVVVRDSAVSSGNIRACPSTVVAEPQRRLDHATQIPFLAQSSAVIRGVLLPKVEVRCLSAARLESANLNTLPKWKGAIIKSICSQSLNCGAHQRAAHYHNCGAHQRALIAEPIKELLIITLLVRLHHLGDQRVALRDRPPVASLERRLEELSGGAI